MKQKILAFFLCAALLMCLFTGCSKPADDNGTDNSTVVQESDSSSQPVSQPQDSGDESSAPPRPNGSLPDNWEDLSEDELNAFYTIVVTSVKTLDLETLAEYTDTTDRCYTNLEAIAANDDWRAFYLKLMDGIIYYPDSQLFIGKSPTYLFDMWYRDCIASNAEIPDHVSELSADEVMAVYDKYYADAPYECSYIDEFALDPSIEDGRISFDIEDIFDGIYFCDYDELLTNDASYQKVLAYGYLLMGEENSLSLGYDYINDEMPDYATVMTLDLDQIVALTDAGVEDDDKKSVSWEAYQKYIVDKNNRAVMQKYLDDNCFAMRNLSGLDIFVPLDAEKDFPASTGTDADRADMGKYNLMKVYRMYSYPKDFNNDFYVFYNMAQSLSSEGKLS